MNEQRPPGGYVSEQLDRIPLDDSPIPTSGIYRASKVTRIHKPPTAMKKEWPDPTPEMLDSPEFEAIWQCIKSWDINVPDAYEGYCGATGNHVRAIMEALKLV